MAGHAPLAVYQGEDWSRTVRWQAADLTYVDFTGYTARMQIRDRADTVLAELTTGNGKITISGTTLTLALDAVATAALAAGTQRYDLFVTSPGGLDTPLLEGPVDVTARVTV